HYANISDGLVGLTLSSADCSFMRLGNSSPNKLDSNIPLISVLAGGQTDGLELGIQGQGGDTHFLQRFAIATQEHNDQTAAMRFALEHQNPLITGKVTGGKDWPENVGMFLKIDNPQVLLWAFKPADDGTDKGIIVRVWNYSPDPAKFTLEIPQIPILQIVKVTHIETTAGNENVSAGKLVASLNPWQMDTYLIVLSEKKLPGLLQQIQL
ncbi:MAG: glycoside hydrolase, partial [Anaerolineaceae bacterium]|nr:glycoside hydrolase [Anaerolineaceae bacterium]